MLRCVCCNSELTAPTLIDGKPYGYTCAANIQGGKKARKNKLVEVVIAKEFKTADGFVHSVRLDIVGTDTFLRRPCNSMGEVVKLITIEDKLYTEIQR